MIAILTIGFVLACAVTVLVLAIRAIRHEREQVMVQEVIDEMLATGELVEIDFEGDTLLVPVAERLQPYTMAVPSKRAKLRSRNSV